jgi:Na+/melibiose symporter-like transporter
MIPWLRDRYGASPWHLLGHLAALAVVGYALWALLDGGTWARSVNLVAWLIGGALLHDFVALPLYSLADRAAQRATGGRRRLLNHLRVPAAISAVLLLVFFPLILVKADANYVRATGRHVEGYARNWLLITAGLFAASALLYAVRSRRDRLDGAAGPPADQNAPAARIDGEGVGLADRGPAS